MNLTLTSKKRKAVVKREKCFQEGFQEMPDTEGPPESDATVPLRVRAGSPWRP